MRVFVMSLMMMSAAQAGEDPQMLAKYRSTMMKGVGAHMGQITLVMKDQVDRKDDLLQNAKAIHEASQDFRALFPSTTGPEAVKTEALPAVWKDAKGFEKANMDWEKASADLVKAIEANASKEDLKAAWGKLGKTCGSCHDTFKEEHH